MVPIRSANQLSALSVPLGLCGFAMTAFVLSWINAHTAGVTVPSIVVGSAYAYGGLIQLLAGMWEMAAGHTFGATALSSYGGFWISYAIIETGGMGLIAEYDSKAELNHAVGFFLAGWALFTFMCLLCTFKSNVAFVTLFVFLEITFLLLTMAHFQLLPDGSPSIGLTKASGVIGLMTTFLAWWNAMAGILDDSNSFFILPVGHFPWSEQGRLNKLNEFRNRRYTASEHMA